MRNSDFNYVPDDEIVTFPSECDRDRNNIDGDCGCRRCMAGVLCHTSTTTMRVSAYTGSVEDFTRIIWQSLNNDATDTFELDKHGYRKTAEMIVTAIQSVVSPYRVGSILEKRGNVFQKRTMAKLE